MIDTSFFALGNMIISGSLVLTGLYFNNDIAMLFGGLYMAWSLFVTFLLCEDSND